MTHATLLHAKCILTTNFLVVLHLQTPSGESDQGDKGLTKHLGCCCLIAVYASYLGKPNDTSKGYIFNNVQSQKKFLITMD